MSGWMLLGCTALALRQIYKYLSTQDEDHTHADATGYQTAQRDRNRNSDPSLRSAFVRNSGGNNIDRTSERDRNRESSLGSPSFRNSGGNRNDQNPERDIHIDPLHGPPSVWNSSSSTENPSSASERSYNSTTTTPVPSSSSPRSKPPASSFSSKASPSSSKTPPSSKPTLSPLHSNSINQQTKQDNYMWVDQKGTSPLYSIPKEIENLIKKDIVPDVLRKPLSPTTYRDYFAALLYAEEFYAKKWSNYQLLNVTLELHEAAIYDKSLKNRNLKESAKKDDKIFVAFEIDSVPERRPFLLSRDFVYARHAGSEAKKFQGLVYRVVKSTVVLVEFEEQFYYQHHQNRKYDISFSFNRVCLKRAHQAISAASGPLFSNYIFPEHAIRKNICSSGSTLCLYNNYKLDSASNSIVCQILSIKGFPPYLIEGPLCASSCEKENLSKTGLVVREAVLEIYKRSSKPRILICSPLNSTGDILMRSLKREIPESVMFRANAAFREVDGVPVDILPLCVYEGECFSFPSRKELKQFKVIFSTFVSSYRLINQGITAGHFSHIFLVDASSATEPETMIPVSNFTNEKTTVILTGAPNNRSGWVRSDIARKYGLRVSYFERLHATNVNNSSNPTFIKQL